MKHRESLRLVLDSRVRSTLKKPRSLTKVIVLSLGGSLIIPDPMDFSFLHQFRKTLEEYYQQYTFAIVCGGGTIARKYIEALAYEKYSEKELSLAGIRATRMNAAFMMQFFGSDANHILPKDMLHVKNDLKKKNVVICGALRYAPHSTSDGTAARLAHTLKAPFINVTNVDGLYTDNPATHKDAKFIPFQTWKEFEKRALKIKHKPGQHFVLDQEAATIIRKHSIPTYIIGKDLANLKHILQGKAFRGTLIEG